jgi:hypothetical protein
VISAMAGAFGMSGLLGRFKILEAHGYKKEKWI